MADLSCPHCGATKLHRKNQIKAVRLDRWVRRYYCPAGCHKTHWRDPDTLEVIPQPEDGGRIQPLATRMNATLAAVLEPDKKALEDELAAVYKVDASQLVPTTKDTRTGRPRVIVNFLSDADLTQLDAQDREAYLYLQTKVMLLKELIAGIRGKIR